MNADREHAVPRFDVGAVQLHGLVAVIERLTTDGKKERNTATNKNKGTTIKKVGAGHLLAEAGISRSCIT